MISIHADRARRALRGAALVAVGTLTLAACDDDVAPPFELEGTGTISGLLFFDADRDGLFEPVEGDSALAGIPLRLEVRGTDEVIPGTETTTDEEGRFTITAPVGSNELVFDEAALGAVVVCQNEFSVSVRPSEVTSVVTSGTPSCLIDIVEAEAEPLGTFVTVRGTVVAAPHQLRDAPTLAYIQDETGGIGVSNLPDGSMQVGDVVQVSGTLVQFGQEFQLNNPTIDELFAGAGDVDTTLITVAQLRDQALESDDPLQGRLVRVDTVEITGAFGADGRNGQNALISRDGANAQLRIESLVSPPVATLNDRYPVGNCYTITGVAGRFNTDPQIKPRTPDDIQQVDCP